MDDAEFEVLVVDNNSTDRTVAIAAAFPVVRVLHQSVQGSYAARNLGVRESTGDVIVFLDPDCVPHPGWLQAVLRVLDAPKVGIVLGRRHYGPSRALALLAKYEDEKIQWILRSGRGDQVYGYTNNMAVRRSVFEEFGPFPQRMRGGDTLFVQRVVSTLGKKGVSFAADMEVDHLEITRLAHYYHKQLVYGASTANISKEVAFRSLSSTQRFWVWWALARRGRVAPWDAVVLLALLFSGVIAYGWARRGAQ